MDSISPQSTLFKRCPTCPEDNQWHPATPEYFARNKSTKDHLSSLCKECKRKKEKARRADPEKREQIKAKRKELMNDPEEREQILAKRREYARRPEVHEKQLARDRAYTSRPEIREHKRAYMETYNRRPEVRERRYGYSREYYHHPIKHAKIRAYHNAYDKVYRRRPDVRQKNQASQRTYLRRPEIREHHNTWTRTYNRRPDVHKKLRDGQRVYYRVYYSRPESKAKKRVDNLTRVARRKAVQGRYTAAQIQEQLKRQRYRCYYAACGHAKFEKRNGKYVFQIEHTYPLSRVAGSDIPANDMSYLVLSCVRWNVSKGNKYPWEWIEGGRLL